MQLNCNLTGPVIAGVAAWFWMLGPSAMAQTPDQHAGAPDTQMESTILSNMHHVNQMEIKAGTLASQKGAAPQVRDFGARLVLDHSMADRKVMSFAKSHNIPIMENMPPPAGAPDPAAMQREKTMDAMQKLSDLQGDEFDKKFLDMMQHGHEMAVTMLEGAHNKLPSGSPLRELVGKVLPVLMQHYDIASRLDLKVTAQMMK